MATAIRKVARGAMTTASHRKCRQISSGQKDQFPTTEELPPGVLEPGE